MCQRLVILTELHLNMSRKELAKRLEYRNQSTLWKAWNGLAFPDVEKLALLSQIVTVGKKTPNIHWLISGYGEVLVSAEHKQIPLKYQQHESETLLLSLLDSLPNYKLNNLIGVLRDP